MKNFNHLYIDYNYEIDNVGGVHLDHSVEWDCAVVNPKHRSNYTPTIFKNFKSVYTHEVYTIRVSGRNKHNESDLKNNIRKYISYIALLNCKITNQKLKLTVIPNQYTHNYKRITKQL